MNVLNIEILQMNV